MIRASIFALSLLTAFAAPAAASGLSAEQVVEVAIPSVDENGDPTVVYEIAEEVAPGDELRYVLTYANGADTAINSVNLVMPVPSEVDLIEGSVEKAGATVSYSVDNGVSFAERGTLKVAVDGVERSATSEDITHIQWSFSEEIPAGTSGKISYRGVLR